MPKPRFGGPDSGRPQVNIGSADSRPEPTGANGDFRRKRAQQLKQRLKALKQRGKNAPKSTAARTQNVERKMNLDAKINELRGVENRSEQQQARLDALKAKFSDVQGKFGSPDSKQKQVGPGMAAPQTKPASDSPQAGPPKTPSTGDLRSRLEQDRFKRGKRGAPTRGRRRPNRSVTASASPNTPGY